MLRLHRSLRRSGDLVLRRACLIWRCLAALFLLSVASAAPALGKVDLTLSAAPGMGVLIYKTESEVYCKDCFQFSKPGPALRINLLLDIAGETWGLRVGTVIFGHLAFQSWSDRGLDLASSSISGVFTAGPTIQNKEVQLSLTASLGGGVEGDSVTVSDGVGLRSATVSLFGAHAGLRFIGLKPLILSIEPASFIYHRYEQKDIYGHTTKLRIDVLWTPNIHIGYNW